MEEKEKERFGVEKGLKINFFLKSIGARKKQAKT